jgi:hypothetical protein
MAARIVIRIEAKLRWDCFPDEGVWVGVCDPLKLTVQADTWAELMEDIGHTLDAMLLDLLQTNELNAFLRDHGWKLHGPIPVRPKNVRFDVPFIPAIMAAHGSQTNIYQ